MEKIITIAKTPIGKEDLRENSNWEKIMGDNSNSAVMRVSLRKIIHNCKPKKIIKEASKDVKLTTRSKK